MTYADPTFTRDYQGLCAIVADTLNRQDLVSAIPNFTVLATTRIARDMTRVRHPSAMAHATAVFNNGSAALPGDFSSVYKLLATSNPLTAPKLEYVSPDVLDELATDSPVGPTLYYTIVSNQIVLLPSASIAAPATLDLWYFTTLYDLNAANPTNWVLTEYPDLYLYGTLVHSAPYLKADARIPTWEAAYQRIVEDVTIAAERATRPQAKLSARTRSF